MRTALAATALGVTLIAAAGLAACSREDPVQPPGPVPSSTPVFASDEEALAAAEEAYQAYLEVANAVAQEGGANPERYGDVVTHAWLKQELNSAEAFEQSGHRQVGDLSLALMTLQQAEYSGSEVVVSAYVCLDISATSFVDASGVDVTPIDRDPIAPLEIVFRGLKLGVEDADSVGRPGRLLVEGSDLWTGQNFC